MKKAYITVHNELLRAMLKLPDTVEIEAIIVDTDGYLDGTFTVVVNGDGLPDFTNCKIGEKAKQVTCIYQKSNFDLVPDVKLKEIKEV